jgi:tetratricopeptide (TPR) repeat protein
MAKIYDNDQINYIKDLYSEHKYQFALKIVKDYVKKYPNDAAGIYEYGRILYALDDKSDAIELYKKVASYENKYQNMALLALANPLFEEDPSLAKEYLLTIIKHPDNRESTYEAYYKLGVIAAKEKDYAQAKAYFAKNIDRYQDTPTKLRGAYISLAEIAYAEKEYEESHKYLDLIEEHFKMDRIGIRSHLLAAKLKYLRGNYSKALLITKKINSSDNNFLREESIALENKIKYQLEKEKRGYTISEADFIKYTTIINKANTEVLLGHKDEALKLYKEAYDSNLLGIKSIAAYKLADFYYTNKDLANSSMYLKDSFDSKSPFYNNAKVLLLSLYIRTKDYAKAKDMLKLIARRKLTAKDKLTYDRSTIILRLHAGEKLTLDGHFNYTEKQLISYDPTNAKEHIHKHSSTTDANDPETSIFNPNVDTDKLFATIKPYLKEENRYFDNLFDCYMVDYPNASIYGQGKNCVRVITLANTKNIITMYPGSKPNIEDKVTKEIKQESAIDKFCKKYGSQYKNK